MENIAVFKATPGNQDGRIQAILSWPLLSSDFKPRFELHTYQIPLNSPFLSRIFQLEKLKPAAYRHGTWAMN